MIVIVKSYKPYKFGVHYFLLFVLLTFICTEYLGEMAMTRSCIARACDVSFISTLVIQRHAESYIEYCILLCAKDTSGKASKSQVLKHVEFT